MKPKDFYETMYAQHHEPPPASYFARMWKKLELYREDAVFRLLDGGERFLDVGCGEGNLVFLAAQKFNQVNGIDFSTPRILRAQEAAKKVDEGRINFLTVDLSQGIPFDDDYFGAASCVATLAYVFDPPALIKELHRVLMPDGELVIQVTNAAYIIHRIRALLGKPPSGSSAGGFMDGGVLHHFTLASLVSLLSQSGLRVVKKGTSGKCWFLRNQWVPLLGGDLVIKAVKK